MRRSSARQEAGSPDKNLRFMQENLILEWVCEVRISFCEDPGGPMKKDIGLWIDRKKAVIVSVGELGAEIKQIESEMEKHVRYSGAPRPKTPYSAQYKQGDDQIDKKFIQHVNKYYGRVITQLRGAGRVLIFGPGEAKYELQKRLAHERVHVRIAGVETADKMTNRQIAAKVRKYFQGLKSGA
jgi:hypothetical protein